MCRHMILFEQIVRKDRHTSRVLSIGDIIRRRSSQDLSNHDSSARDQASTTEKWPRHSARQRRPCMVRGFKGLELDDYI